jgi:hypothetical protein
VVEQCIKLDERECEEREWVKSSNSRPPGVEAISRLHATGSTSFRAKEVVEIEEALRGAKARGKTLATLTRDDFPLPKVAQRIAFARDFLENDKGVYQLRGIKIDDYSKDDLRLMYWGPGLHIGTAVSQSKDGDILGDVRNVGSDKYLPGAAATSRVSISTSTPIPPTSSACSCCASRCAGA